MSAIMETIHTFYQRTKSGIMGYYSIGNSPIKYDNNVNLNEILDAMERGFGPQHCTNCDVYGSIRGVFIGFCASCAYILVPTNTDTCTCFYRSGGSIADYVQTGGKGCHSRNCRVKNLNNPHEIGNLNYVNTEHIHHRVNNKITVISTHTRFVDYNCDEDEDDYGFFNDISDDEDEDEDKSSMVSLYPKNSRR
jgi:hypothetical protein